MYVPENGNTRATNFILVFITGSSRIAISDVVLSEPEETCLNVESTSDIEVKYTKAIKCGNHGYSFQRGSNVRIISSYAYEAGHNAEGGTADQLQYHGCGVHVSSVATSGATASPTPKSSSSPSEASSAPSVAAHVYGMNIWSPYYSGICVQSSTAYVSYSRIIDVAKDICFRTDNDSFINLFENSCHAKTEVQVGS